MTAHLNYLRSLLRHKWFVAVAGSKLGVSWWALLVHDWSKFTPAEWGGYVQKFYGKAAAERAAVAFQRTTGALYRPDPIWDQAAVDAAFDAAWLHHQKIQPHHWQAWVLVTDQDEPRIRPLPMPEKYVREMVADWCGAGRAYTGRWDVAGWYEQQRERVVLHPDTRALVEQLVREAADVL
jgi:hypothetical protein